MSMERWSFPFNFKNSSNRWLGEHPLNSPQKQTTDSKTSFWLSLIVGRRLKSVAVRWSLLGPDNGEANDDIHLPSNDDIYGNHDNGFPGILGRPMCLWPPPLTAMGFPTVRESGFPRGGQITRRQTSGSGESSAGTGSQWLGILNCGHTLCCKGEKMC